MIDLHSHILPGLDDGAADQAQALEMAHIAQDEGISGIIATPHYMPGSFTDAVRVRVEEVVDSLNELCRSDNVDVKIYPGCEIAISTEIPDLMSKGLISTLNRSKYLLIELPMTSIPIYVENVIFELELQGLIPIIAHPERNSQIIERPSILAHYMEKGILVQVNAGSITGFYGDRVRRTVIKLVERGMVHFVSSDAHNTRTRAPLMKRAYADITDRMGIKVADLLFYENPGRVLENMEVVSNPVFPANKSRFGKIIDYFRKV